MSVVSRLTGLLGGWQGYAAAAGLSALLAAGGAWWLAATVYGAEIDRAERARAEEHAASATAALTKMQDNLARIGAAADHLAGVRAGLETTLSNAAEELRNAQAAHPLPADCKPDARRVRALHAAVAAANAAASGQVPRGAVPATP